MTSDSLAPIGVIDHYNLLEQIDSSGPGELYRARDTKHGRTVAVRLLPADFTTDPGALVATARVVQVLSHPNAIAVFGVGQHKGRIFIAFEFLKGRSLRSEMGGRAMNVRRAVDLAIQIADAVAEAHAAGFVHGGLSPDTIIITAKGHAKIPAFHLAVQTGLDYANGEVRLHDYESPEEARGEAADDRSDIYSIGAVLYEMLTTRKPVHRGSSAPSASNPEVSKELDAIVLKAVAPNPASRYQGVAAFAADLRAMSPALELDEPEESTADEKPASVGRIALITLIVMVVVVAILWWFTRS